MIDTEYNGDNSQIRYWKYQFPPNTYNNAHSATFVRMSDTTTSYQLRRWMRSYVDGSDDASYVKKSSDGKTIYWYSIYNDTDSNVRSLNKLDCIYYLLSIA